MYVCMCSSAFYIPRAICIGEILANQRLQIWNVVVQCSAIFVFLVKFKTKVCRIRVEVRNCQNLILSSTLNPEADEKKTQV